MSMAVESDMSMPLFLVTESSTAHACVALLWVDHLTDWKWKLLIHPDLISNIQGRSISTLCSPPGTLRLAKVWWKAFNPLNKTIHFKTQISLQIRFLRASGECSIILETSKFVPQSKPSLWKLNFWSPYTSNCIFCFKQRAIIYLNTQKRIEYLKWYISFFRYTAKFVNTLLSSYKLTR